MSYAKKAASCKPKEVQLKGPPSQRTEQQNLLSFIRSGSGDRTSNRSPVPGPRVVKPPQSLCKPPTLQRNFPKAGPIDLENKFKKLNIEEVSEEDKKKSLNKSISQLETPFVWKPQGNFKSNLARAQEKSAEIKDHRRFKWRNYILELVICYELYKAKDPLGAIEKIKCLEDILAEATHRIDQLFLAIDEALWHVINASKAFLFMETNCVKEAEKVIDEILPVYAMRRSCKAGIMGIKAAVFMEYGHQGNKKAAELMNEATKLDPANAEWHFLLAKAMGRIRRVAQCHAKVHKVEIQAFGKALDLEKNNPLYMVYLAQVLRESAFREFKITYPAINTPENKKLDKRFRAAWHKYKDARELCPDCPHLLIRCAYGVMKMPLRMVDLKFIRECIDQALELAPNNPMALHVKGQYYERFHVELDTAKESLQKAAEFGNFGACMDLIRMNFKLNQTNIIEQLEAVAERFKNTHEMLNALTQAGSYLLFIEKDFVGALKYFLKVVTLNEDCYFIKSHKSLFIRMKDPVNMFDVLLEELDSRTNWSSFSEENKKVLKLFRIKARHQDLEPGEKKERLTVQKILEMSKTQGERDEKKLLGRKRLLERNGKMFRRWEEKEKNEKNINSKNKKLKIDPDVVINQDKKMDLPVQMGNGEKYSDSRRHNPNKRKPNSNNRGRESSMSSATSSRSRDSSVDSDYIRNPTAFGQRGFFLGDGPQMIEKYDTVDLDSEQSDMAHKYSSERIRSSQGRDHSRDTRLSSASSDQEKVMHVSRRNQKMPNVPNETVEVGLRGRFSELTVGNLKTFDSELLSLPRRVSMMSIDSDSVSNSSVESLTVMERVKQSYGMLHKNSRNDNQKKNNFQRSESTQSLNRHKNKPRKVNKSETSVIERSQSTQSLNRPLTSFKYSDGYKPAMVLRGSSVESNRSLSFMPSFSQNDT